MSITLGILMLLFGAFLFLRPASCVKSTGEVGEEKKKSVKAVGVMFMSIAVIQALFAIFDHLISN